MTDTPKFTKEELAKFLLDHIEPLQKGREAAMDFFNKLKPAELMSQWPSLKKTFQAAKADAVKFCDMVDASVDMLREMQGKPMDTAGHSDRNWPEDFDGENGKYHNICTACNLSFIGNKRRVVCRMCATHAKSER